MSIVWYGKKNLTYHYMKSILWSGTRKFAPTKLLTIQYTHHGTVPSPEPKSSKLSGLKEGFRRAICQKKMIFSTITCSNSGKTVMVTINVVIKIYFQASPAFTSITSITLSSVGTIVGSHAW